MIGSVIFGAVFMFAYTHLYETPQERKLKSENKFLSENLTHINQRLENINSELEQISRHDNQLYRVIYQMDSIPGKVRNSGFGGTDRYTNLKGREHSDLVIKTSQRIDQLTKKLNIQKNSFNQLSSVLKNETERVQHLPIIQPINNKGLTRIGSYYGMRLHPILGIYRMHDGIDLTAPTGTPVYASGAGKVVRVDHNRTRRGYGNLVVIDHGFDGLSSRYAHLNSIKVKKGQTIERGEQIGTVGSTGLSTGPHLHYEIRREGKTINPLYYYLNVSANQYDQLIDLAQVPGKSFD
ncbi:MAG TPA: peptidoglycan DD-metalloendopeptidase family protein [Bacteroidales bacterium]|nr:peptidoglycan DD-metalloendopeptidase family protein [Bacteroidales bacterium]